MQGPAADRRPTVHFTARSGWVNDPVGLVHHAGRYHLFYQYVPGHTRWRPFCSWGHSSSPDLVSWSEHEPALSPGDGDLGCWSGRLLVDDGTAVIYYTSVNEPTIELGAVREARPVDHDWSRWIKGPVVVTPPDGRDVVAFRDPTVVRDGDVWRMLVGAGYADGRAAVLSYSSPDLRTWSYDGPAVERAPRENDGDVRQFVWECPHIIEVGGQHLLVVSVWADGHTSHVEAAVGNYREGRFTAEAWMPLTYGPGHYAATPFTDAAGRPGLMFWIRGVGGPNEGWAGAQSIPYLLAVEDHKARLRPHPALKTAPRETAGVVGFDWSPSAVPDRLDLQTASGRGLARLETRETTMIVSVPGSTLELPRDTTDISVLADQSILEVCTGTAVAALRLASDDGTPQQPAHRSIVSWWPSDRPAPHNE